jgi:hypothetical protein
MLPISHYSRAAKLRIRGERSTAIPAARSRANDHRIEMTLDQPGFIELIDDWDKSQRRLWRERRRATGPVLVRRSRRIYPTDAVTVSSRPRNESLKTCAPTENRYRFQHDGGPGSAGR